MYDPLFMALAQAKSLPSHGFRAFQSAMAIPGQAAEGLSEGYKLKRMIQQPEALARVFASTPQGQDVLKTAGPDALINSFYGVDPNKMYGEALPRQAQTATSRDLGLRSIAERDTASKRNYDLGMRKTDVAQDIFGSGNLTKNISGLDAQITALNAENSRLAAQIPGGIGGTIQKTLASGGDIGQFLQDPKFSGIAAQMKTNAEQLRQAQMRRDALSRTQGMIPQALLDNPAGAAPGGDSSIPGEALPGLSF